MKSTKTIIKRQSDTYSTTLRLTLTALFTALTCVATMIIRIPSPTDGYINIGDCMVLISAWQLGPLYGGIAAATGSMLADVLSGYLYYAPATFFIKLLMAVIAYYIYKISINRSTITKRIFSFCSALSAELIMVIGYFVFSAVFLGTGLGAAAGIPANLIQGITSIIISVLLKEFFSPAKI